MKPIECVLEQLEGARATGPRQWQTRCPAHPDENPSLSITETADGRVLLKCFAGCTTEKIVSAINLKMADLFPPRQGNNGRRGSPKMYATVDDAAREAAQREKGEVEAVYQYTPSYYRVRIRKADGKTFRPIRHGNTGWVLGDPPPPLPLYGGDQLADAATIHIVEGEKATDAARGVGLVAVTSRSSSSAPKADWKPLAGRKVVVLPDADEPGEKYARAVALELRKLSPPATEIRVVRLPDLPEHGDIYDFVAARRAGGAVDDAIRREVERLAETAPVAPDKPTRPDDGGNGTACRYESTPCGLVYNKPTPDGYAAVPLTNFGARIVGQVAHDDGVEIHRAFELEATLHGRSCKCAVSAAQFSGMNWAIDHLGAQAIVFPGFGLREHARAAIQVLSTDLVERTIFTHTGWRKVGDTWVYLHAGGAIGTDGPVAGVEVAMPSSLERYSLPDPPTGDALVTAVQASLHVLHSGPAGIVMPLFAAIWRAVLGPASFSLHLAGQTGVFKTELAALAQQHFGAAMTARSLPGSWSSTGNALEALAFAAKDALLVVDDFAPCGSSADVQRFHREADRLIRAQGNRSGRQRLRPDATLQAVKAPRGLIVSTGEDIPRGNSLRARTLVLEVAPGSVDTTVLTRCQVDARDALYATVTAGFVRWLAPRFNDSLESLPREVAELRTKATQEGQHRRTPEIVADLLIGFRYFLMFAVEVGAIKTDEDNDLRRRAWAALGEAAAAQAAHHRASDPVQRFLELLGAAIASGHAHVATLQGTEPHCDSSEDGYPGAWGWRLRVIGAGDHAREEWQPQGDRIGWIDGGDLYLQPDAAFRAAQVMAGSEPITVTSKTLRKRLAERGLLASTDAQRGRLTVRITAEQQRRSVLHLYTGSLMHGEPAQPTQLAHDRAPEAQNTGGGPISWAGPNSPEPKIGPAKGPLASSEGGFGLTGPIGPIPQIHGVDQYATGAGAQEGNEI